MSDEEEGLARLRRMDPRLVLTKFIINIVEHADEKPTVRNLSNRLNEVGLQVSYSSLKQWIGNYKENGSISRESGLGGRPRLLDDNEIKVIIGWILKRYYDRKETHITDVKKFTDEYIFKDIDMKYIWKVCRENGITYKMIVEKGPDINVSIRARNKLHMEFINEMKRREIFTDPEKQKNIFCMDFTYNSQRGLRRKSLSPVGGQSPKAKLPHPGFTNCFVVGNSPTGKSLPTIVFTHDPIFDTRIAKNYEIVSEKANEIAVSRDSIFFVPPTKATTYCRESSEIVAFSLNKWGKDIPEKTGIFFTDGGSAFKKKDQSVFDAVEALAHYVMPSEAHAHISTCDSGVNSAAKNKWRRLAAEGVFRIDTEPESTLYLLKCFDEIEEAPIKKYWRRNFDLDRAESSLDDVTKMVSNAGYKWEEFHNECIGFHMNYMVNGLIEYPESTRINQNRNTGLNGKAYATPASGKRRRI